MEEQGGTVPLITGFSRNKPNPDTTLQYGATDPSRSMAYPQSGIVYNIFVIFMIKLIQCNILP